MKKAVLLVLVLMSAAAVSQAATTGQTLKEEGKKWGSFWSREGERSGLKESTSNWGNFWTNANPVNFFKNQQDAYNARKSGGAQQ